MKTKWAVQGCRNLLTTLFKVLHNILCGPSLLLDSLVMHDWVLRSKIKSKPEEGEVDVVSTLPEDNCPEFQELIEIGGDVIIGIEKVIHNPDETALVRVLDATSFSKQFKKKISSDGGKGRFTGGGAKYIKVDNKKYYLKKCIPIEDDGIVYPPH